MPLLTATELSNLLETAAYDKNTTLVLEDNLYAQLAEKVTCTSSIVYLYILCVSIILLLHKMFLFIKARMESSK